MSVLMAMFLTIRYHLAHGHSLSYYPTSQNSRLGSGGKWLSLWPAVLLGAQRMLLA